mmetsp:Transcript_60500/g.148437  ORF Transcript_60500/g.148437 Transcript_60500/m.148437 type:complete len:226 (+) Transcript_60500:158-835(+)
MFSQGLAVCCRYTLLLFLSMAIVLSGMAVASCRFMKFVDADGEDGSVGLYRYYNNETMQCINHPEEVEYTESTNAARMGGVVAFLAGVTVLLFEIIDFCCCRICCSGLIKSVLLLVATIMQGLTFLLFGSVKFCDGDLVTELLHQTPCTVDEGAAASAAAVVFFFVSGILVNCTPRPKPVIQGNKDVEMTGDGGDDTSMLTTKTNKFSERSGEVSDDNVSHKNIV